MLRDFRLGASLVAFKEVRPKEEDEIEEDEIWIPKHVATTRRLGPTGAVVYDPTGAVVYDVRPNSAAQEVGLIPGDIIVAVDGIRVFGVQGLKHKLDSRVGDSVKFYLWRYYFPGGWERVYLDRRLGD
jgi:S1-C subfamily serine protease